MLDKLTRSVGCSFLQLNGRERELKQFDMRVPTGSSSYHQLVAECQRWALDQGFTMWTQPAVLSSAWYVFRVGATSLDPAVACKELPTRESAEMWMIHGGD